MTACRYVARDQPRALLRFHAEDCRDDGCKGCLPCLEPHCRVCGRVHVAQTCAECTGATREDLHAIADMCGALSTEALHRGVESEAMTLLGPAADPEAWGHLSTSVKVGRLPKDYISEADGELHPLFVLGTWDSVWRDALDHEPPVRHRITCFGGAGCDCPQERLTVATAFDYLDLQLTYMAGYEHAPFEDFAADLRRCRAHLEQVLHDGEQHDTGAPCMRCEIPLERVWGKDEHADGWRCPRCKERSTEDQYRFAVAHLHREEATHLTDRDCEIRTGVKAGTIREWARRGHVTKRLDSGRMLYAVADVMARIRA